MTDSDRERELQHYKNRFNPIRYQLSGTSRFGPSDIVPQYPGLNAHPKSDSMQYFEEDSSSSEED